MERYYIETHGNDDEAYRESIQFACKYVETHPDITRVVFLSHRMDEPGWLVRLLGKETVKTMLKSGYRFNDCDALFVIKSVKNYSEFANNQSSDFVITLGLGSSEIQKFDGWYRISAIIAIPWMEGSLQEWVKMWTATELRSQTKADSFPEPNPLVGIAFSSLSDWIKHEGFGHASDEHEVKTVVLALHKYVGIKGDEVASYLVQEMDWNADPAREVKLLIDKLNEGKHFKGGQRTGLKDYVKRWKEKLSQS